MNTIVSYIMGFALYVIALFLPHQTEATSISVLNKFEEKSEVVPKILLTINKVELEENIKLE